MKKLLLLSMVSLLLTTWAAAGEVFYNENPWEDAYVVEGDTGPGTDIENLYIQGDGEAVRSLLKFDTSSIPDGAVITSAVFGIYLEEASGGAFSAAISPDGDLFYVANDSWDDSTVDWAFSQGLTADNSTRFGIESMPNDDQYIEWDLLNSSGIDITQVPIDDYLSFMLRTANESAFNYGVFYSTESEIFKPYLKITYTNVVPAPGSITLAIIGLSSVMAIRRKKRSL